MRQICALFVVSVVAAACSSGVAPTPTGTVTAPPSGTPVATTSAPSASPLLPTAPPTIAPTLPPTLPPILPPTLPPTSSPLPTLSVLPTTSAGPTQSPAGGLIEMFNDSFTLTPSGWGTGPVGDDEIAYSGGRLELSLNATGRSIWSRRSFDAGPFSAARIEGEVIVDSDGVAGLMCGSDDDEMHGMLLATDGRWFAVRIGAAGEGGGLTILEQGTTEELIFTIDEVVRLDVGCAIVGGELTMSLAAGPSGEAPAHVAVYVGDTQVVGFDRAAVYAEALEAPHLLQLDNVVAAAGEAGAGGRAEQLLAHVPEAYRASCRETPPPAVESEALVAVVCELDGGAGAEIIEYVQFTDYGAMYDAYFRRVDAWGAESTGTTCREGPAEGSYQIGEEEAGNLLCAEQRGGIRFDWTDTRLSILTSATDLDGSYADLYATWQEAGPDL